MVDIKAWTIKGNTPAQNALLIAAMLTDRVKVREVGANRGYWVKKFLGSVGLGEGYAWCAAFVSFCLREAGYKHGPKIGRAAVRNWAKWAEQTGRITVNPKRGDLFFWLNKGGMTGHIGFVVDVKGGKVFTIEGNTNAVGSREGDGAYRQERNKSSVRFIRL